VSKFQKTLSYLTARPARIPFPYDAIPSPLWLWISVDEKGNGNHSHFCDLNRRLAAFEPSFGR